MVNVGKDHRILERKVERDTWSRRTRGQTNSIDGQTGSRDLTAVGLVPCSEGKKRCFEMNSSQSRSSEYRVAAVDEMINEV